METQTRFIRTGLEYTWRNLLLLLGHLALVFWEFCHVFLLFQQKLFCFDQHKSLLLQSNPDFV